MFDIVVIGAGHAGCEAAKAAACRGARVALVTFDSDNLGQMSCNPSIGGVGKGHLVRELDVFGGLMARAADAATIHRRMLNRSKGSAVHGPRVQADRRRYRAAISQLVDCSGLTIVEGEVARIRLTGQRVSGVELGDGSTIEARAIVIATGTFLGAKLYCGLETMAGGRAGERSSLGLADQVEEWGIAEGRLKTGTPPRLDGRTIDWATLERQTSEPANWSMSAQAPDNVLPQIDCAITRTTAGTHDIISANFGRSPLFAGAIEGRGPRYCPSIEDKVKRFGARDSHQIFLEPEGLDSDLVYPNGISTSLPADVQQAFVRTIPGLERAEIARSGYAVEYGFLDPRRLDATLAHGDIGGLFLAGQVNGTTGYEEAAAQGLVAGLNAAALACDLAPVRFERSSSYIGVMIDDLTLQGVTEPYRMMTARAEFRLHLRADNAMTRLGEQAIAANCLDDCQRVAIEDHAANCRAADGALDEEVSGRDLLGDGSSERKALREWLLRPDTRSFVAARLPVSAAVDEVIADAEYAPYLARQQREWSAMQQDASVKLPAAFQFDQVPGMSVEMIERLAAARPETLGQAARIRGVTPAALSALHFAIARAA